MISFLIVTAYFLLAVLLVAAVACTIISKEIRR